MTIAPRALTFVALCTSPLPAARRFRKLSIIEQGVHQAERTPLRRKNASGRIIRAGAYPAHGYTSFDGRPCGNVQRMTMPAFFVSAPN